MPIHLQSNFGMGSDFGAADYNAAVHAGATPAELRAWAQRNPNQFINENAVGAGGLYDSIMSGSTPRGARPGIDNNPTNAAAGNWIGNPNTYDPNARGYTISRAIAAMPTAPTIQAQQPILSAPTNYAQFSSPEYTQQTYDPNLGYERPGNPGDTPYISNYTPIQESYMNDPSTLSAEELAYRKGNIQGVNDRWDSIENQGAASQFLDDWILDLTNDPGRQAETQIDTIAPEDSNDNNDPYEQYRTDQYY